MTMKNMKFDDVFDLIGQMGVFQVFVFILISISAFLSTETIYVNFTAYAMDHWCRISYLEHLPNDLQKYISIPTLTSGGKEYDQCHYIDLNYSLYSQEDFYHWNRSHALSGNLPVKKCQSWVYDQSIFTETAVSQVCNEVLLPFNLIQIHVHSEKSSARPMLFYSTNYWQQFWVQFVV